MKDIIIYPGRFQPMLPHHAAVFKELVSRNPNAEVYIATANKVEAGKSPFDAEEKIEIMTKQHDIPRDRIIIPANNNLYNRDSYAKVFVPADQHTLSFAVGEKDMDEHPRFDFKPLKDGGKPYLQPHPENEGLDDKYITTGTLDNMLVHAYVKKAPNIPGIDGNVASASAFRQALMNAPDLNSAKETYAQYMGEFNQEIFDIVYDKITGKIMKENIEILKKLAGLLDEAPVNFKPGKGGMDYEPGVSNKDQKAAAERPARAAASDPTSVGFTKIAPKDMISVDTGRPINSKQRARSMANQFPDGADVNDPAVKKEMFLKLLAQSPGYVLGEINARLANDDEGFAVSDRLSQIVDNLPEGGIMALPKADRKWTIELVNNAINNMELARKDAELDDFGDDGENPSIDAGSYSDADDDPDAYDGMPGSKKPLDKLTHPMDRKAMGEEKDKPKNCGCGKNPCETYGNPEEAIEEAKPEVQSVINANGKKVEYTVLNGEPFDVNGAPLQYKDYYDVMVGNDYGSDISINSAWNDYEEAHKGVKGYGESMQELRKLAGLNEGGECYQCDGENEDCPQCKGTGYVQYDDDPNEPSDEEIQANADAYELYKKNRDKLKDKKESIDLSAVIEEIVGEDDYDNKYDNEPTTGQMGFEDLCDYLNVTPEECEMDIKDVYDVQDMNDIPKQDNPKNLDAKELYMQQVLIPTANEKSMDHAEYESIEEFQKQEPADFGDPDDEYKLMYQGKQEIKMFQQMPGFKMGTKFVAISPPTSNQPAFAMVKDENSKESYNVTQDKLSQVGLTIVGAGPKGQQELPLPKPQPHQPELGLTGGGMAKDPSEESVEHAIDNALDETVDELRKLAGI